MLWLGGCCASQQAAEAGHSPMVTGRELLGAASLLLGGRRQRGLEAGVAAPGLQQLIFFFVFFCLLRSTSRTYPPRRDGGELVEGEPVPGAVSSSRAALPGQCLLQGPALEAALVVLPQTGLVFGSSAFSLGRASFGQPRAAEPTGRVSSQLCGRFLKIRELPYLLHLGLFSNLDFFFYITLDIFFSNLGLTFSFKLQLNFQLLRLTASLAFQLALNFQPQATG